MRSTYRRAGALAAMLVTAALTLAACSGSGPTPQVASLGNNSSSGGTGSSTSNGNSTAAAPTGNATKLVDEWAACERSHGDPNQSDPIIDTHGGIDITIPKGALPAGDPHDVTGTCSQYLTAAQIALRKADPVQDPNGVTNSAVIVAFAKCMRDNGVPNYPYPSGPNDSQTNFQGTGVNPNSPSVVRVNDLCGKKLGLPAWWINGWGPPGDISVSTAGVSPNGNPPPCFYSTKAGCSNTAAPGDDGGSGG
jgi:hypothetical protein